MYSYFLLRHLLSDRYGTFFNSDYILFSIDLIDAYLHIPIVKHHHLFMVCLAVQTFSLEGLSIELDTAPSIFTLPTNPILFLCSKLREHVSFCAPCCFILDYILIFPSLDLNTLDTSFLGLCCDKVDMSVSLPSDKPLVIQQLVHTLLQR